MPPRCRARSRPSAPCAAGRCRHSALSARRSRLMCTSTVRSFEFRVVPPDAVEQLLAREDAARVLQEMAQQPEFGRAEMDRLAGTVGAMRHQVHLEIGVAQHAVFRLLLGAPDHGAHPRDQLVRAERLDDIVVGAAVQTANPVALLAARGQHDDRQRAGRRRPPDLPAYFETRDVRQHPIEQHRVGPALGDAQQRLLAVGRLVNGETLALQIVAQHRDKRCLVFDDQDNRFHLPSTLRRADCGPSARGDVIAPYSFTPKSGLRDDSCVTVR